MLGLGQYVDIVGEPARGWLDFDRDNIGMKMPTAGGQKTHSEKHLTS